MKRRVKTNGLSPRNLLIYYINFVILKIKKKQEISTGKFSTFLPVEASIVRNRRCYDQL